MGSSLSTAPRHSQHRRRLLGPDLWELMASALDVVPIGLILLGPDGCVRLITERAAELLGVPEPGSPARLSLARLLATSDLLEASMISEMMLALRQAETHPAHLQLTLRDAGIERVLALDLRSANRLGFVLSIEDITQSRQTQDWLLEHVSTDPVTGLWNRQHFMLMLHDALSAGSLAGNLAGHAVMMIGLHGFKQINATLGALEGDALLRLVADRIGALLHPTDMMARCAGDEFALAVSAGAEGPAAPFCVRLAQTLAIPYEVGGQMVTLGAHIGVARAPQDGVTAEELVGRAGLALMDARDTSGIGLRFFDPTLTERAQQRRALETDLTQALERNEFELFYQPQVDVQHGRITGMEALIRWRSPTRGLVPPIQFIPLTEEMGLIGELGEWVLRTACREAVRWPEEITVAVNASPLQFETGDFAAAVAEALAASGLAPHRLEIEITENLLLRDTGAVTATLAALHAQGVRLVLDDFGTGYASLSQLSRFRFDKIKIDRSFIGSDDAALHNSAIVRSIAALGHSLGIPTTAEGVETANQLAQIKEDGCTCVQGYFFSRPVPATEIDSMMLRLHQPPAPTLAQFAA